LCEIKSIRKPRRSTILSVYNAKCDFHSIKCHTANNLKLQNIATLLEPTVLMHMVLADCLYSAWSAGITCAKCVYSYIWYWLTAYIQHDWLVLHAQSMYTHAYSVSHLPVLSMVGWYYMCRACILMYMVSADCLYLAWSASTICAKHVYSHIWYQLTACIQHGWLVLHVQSRYTHTCGISHLPVYSTASRYHMCKAHIVAQKTVPMFGHFGKIGLP
jgi:hypothetical protein